MTDPWMDGAIPGRSPRTQRARLALLLLIALALPVIIVAVGSRQPVAQTLDMAGADETVLATAPTTVQEWGAVQEWRADRASTSEADEEETTSTTEAPTTTAAPTTAAPTTATTAKPTTTSAKPTTTTTKPVEVAVQAAPVTTPAPTTTAKPVVAAAPTTGGATAAEAAFLACVRQRESGGNYAIVSRDGLYMGAYQFYQGTWNSAANIAGRPDLVGLKPNTVAPADQDAVALAYYRAAGASPWGGHCG